MSKPVEYHMPQDSDDRSWTADVTWVVAYSIAIFVIILVWAYVPG
jgi:hypothetical protein